MAKKILENWKRIEEVEEKIREQKGALSMLLVGNCAFLDSEYRPKLAQCLI